MDLNTIITHLENFVDTWEGWGKVFGGLDDIIGVYEFSDILGLSSNFDDASSEIITTSSDSVELSSGLIQINND
ncbi:hypothetical protein [Corynebacterium lipophiloflavum]|uniref:Uncharacterized protein n=1 Tax=Corynebacterium lipophiloflavum (strain ATCC 700352 / DSM 44291 / CCUG 37336 / JCM 10383 / DMMZ 1944) TaxID=525263 RepID=C0XP34_CORLD|nr:hypothetical protein [Corynebacterium lipophiloflavum]EEI17987.1 hypothetical protein HMPREF0298_0204 [Corynebacterium lipophiloflavum DSM 44291]